MLNRTAFALLLLLPGAACAPGRETTENGIVFVRICPGTFTMGSAEDEEGPAHQVTLREFSIGKTEVTNAQYRRFRPDHPGEDNLPATDVSWDDAKAACEHFGGRLPTEAEWEYAARGGTQTAWFFGNDEKQLGDYAWYRENSGNVPHPVGMKKPNAWGLYDMYGNVAEWVADWFQESSPLTDTHRVLRGGQFINQARNLRSAFRMGTVPSHRSGGVGFRCARDPRPSVLTDAVPQPTSAAESPVTRDADPGRSVALEKQSGTPMAGKSEPVAPGGKTCVPGKERTEDGIVYVRICPGTFTMGSADDDELALGGEQPAHQVTLSEFWLAKTEMTNKQYSRFRPDHRRADRLPVVSVSWDEAKTACEHFGGRLPTEAEWEYAARASSQTAWSFGDDGKILGDYAWYEKNSGKPHRVGTKKPNTWGLHDMLGNVWEWVADWQGTSTSQAQTDPHGPATGSYRVWRGGSFHTPAWGLRSASRSWTEPATRSGDIGFRCAHDPRRDAK